jgi:hypothetical protein
VVNCDQSEVVNLTGICKQFKKELKGDKNADFYDDKTTKNVFLKSIKSENWINTGKKFD